VNRSWLVPVIIVMLAAPSAAQRRDKYEPSGGRFSVRFLGPPKESTQTAKSQLGDLKVVTATYADSSGNAYMVSYTDFPEGAAKSDASGKLFDGVRDGLKKDGKFIDENDVEIGTDKHPGRDIELEKDKKRMKFRVVLRDGRLYQVAVIGSTSFVMSRDAKAFLESFELTK
jgi:hypothetical protein